MGRKAGVTASTGPNCQAAIERLVEAWKEEALSRQGTEQRKRGGASYSEIVPRDKRTVVANSTYKPGYSTLASHEGCEEDGG